MNALKTLKRSLGKLGKSKTTPNRKAFLQMETLEERVVPVIYSGYGELKPDLGTIYDGVVRVGEFTGTLLSTGRHILTAARAVDANRDKVADNGGHFEVQFDLPTGPLTVTSTAAYIPSQWTGGDFSDYDFAILELPSIAPVEAHRFDIYRNFDESGKFFVLAGYGVSGNSGGVGVPSTEGIKRLGINVVDSVAPANLSFDLDVTTFLPEAINGYGDEGAPGLIVSGDDAKIVGVVSRRGLIPPWETKPWGVMGRVSTSASWIDEITLGKQDIVVDMNTQTGGGDGALDEILLDISGDQLIITINGVEHVEDLANIGSLTIAGTSDPETVTLGAYFDFDFAINLGLGYDVLSGPDTFVNWEITGPDAGNLGEDKTFSGIETLFGGTGIDIFKFHADGSISGHIHGGSSALAKDYLDYSLLTGDVEVDLADQKATKVGGFVVDIENVYGGSGNDRLVGDTKVNFMVGGDGNDYLNGGGGDDSLYGGLGDDKLQAHGGMIQLMGEGGNDTYVFVSTSTPSNIYVGGGEGDSDRDRLDFRGSTAGVNVNLGVVDEWQAVAENLSLFLYAEQNDAIGSAFNDVIRGNSQRNYLYGGDGKDRLYGGAGNDKLKGGRGNDRLYGQSGKDRLYGQSGRDRLYGGSGRDVLKGGSGRDVLKGGSGRDKLYGNSGRDKMYGQGGVDFLDGKKESYWKARIANWRGWLRR